MVIVIISRSFQVKSVNTFAKPPIPPIMSMTSSATAPAAGDQIPSDGVGLHNCMCILVLTRGDGILFDVASIQEENIIEICISLGHTHPKGVLQYSAVKSVMLFHSTDDMQLLACGVIKAMTLHEESITILSSPPSATHVRAYMAVMDGEPSGTPHPTPDREADPQLSPRDPHPGGRTPMPITGKPWGPCSSWRISARRLLSGT